MVEVLDGEMVLIISLVLTLIHVLKKSRNEIQSIVPVPVPVPVPAPNPARSEGKFKDIVWSSQAVKFIPISVV